MINKKMQKGLGFFSISMLLLSQYSFAQTNKASMKPELLFQSGFEGTSRVVQDTASNDHGAYLEYLTGVDNTLRGKNNWDKDWAATVSSGRMEIQYTGGDSTKRYAKVVPDQATLPIMY